MAHLVESMMYVGKEPWHGLGKEIPEGKKLGIDEALVAAGLDWEVDLRRLYTEDGYTLLNIHERYAVCRQKDNTLSSLWFGDSARVNKRALDAAMKMAA